MRLLNIFLALTTLLLINACGKDDAVSDQGLSGTVTFNETASEISNGLIVDFGPVDGAYNYDFYLSDSEVNLLGQSMTGSIVIYMELFNSGDAFSSGTFEFGSEGERYFPQLTVQSGRNVGVATGGTVTISGTGSAYEVIFNVTFRDEVTLTGTVTGTYASQAGLF